MPTLFLRQCWGSSRVNGKHSGCRYEAILHQLEQLSKEWKPFLCRVPWRIKSSNCCPTFQEEFRYKNWLSKVRHGSAASQQYSVQKCFRSRWKAALEFWPVTLNITDNFPHFSTSAELSPPELMTDISLYRKQNSYSVTNQVLLSWNTNYPPSFCLAWFPPSLSLAEAGLVFNNFPSSVFQVLGLTAQQLPQPLKYSLVGVHVYNPN